MTHTLRNLALPTALAGTRAFVAVDIDVLMTQRR